MLAQVIDDARPFFGSKLPIQCIDPELPERLPERVLWLKDIGIGDDTVAFEGVAPAWSGARHGDAGGGASTGPFAAPD
ncbi:MAG: hypothetical protein IPN64_15165 [Propionivibrio sp.]|uniref:hypothetical protein n=1 Tax=Propionivibrio sp. TaxID=2212460 RepID=UPI0025EB17F0|nr:hypothetical protein [Propionivibrio sp.]MBK8895316.1 hypothetical protein [Propionivibrio sp.]